MESAHAFYFHMPLTQRRFELLVELNAKAVIFKPRYPIDATAEWDALEGDNGALGLAKEQQVGLDAEERALIPVRNFCA